VASGVVLSTMIAVFTARFIVWPPLVAPARADAIVMMAGSAGRLERAIALARAGYAPVLVVSSPPSAEERCPKPDEVPGVEVICFSPDPLTTQGESRFAADLAERRGWDSLLVVAGATQVTRASLRMSRCFDGQTTFVGVRPPADQLPYLIAYEWAALVKALVVQRSC
jgi:uncharacterized SAM-binding protein YcdF (DUF218 family)